MSSFHQLPRPELTGIPIELLDEVISLLPLSTQLSLCLVSKLFNDHTTPHVYRKVELSSITSIGSFSRTACSKPAITDLVEELTYNFRNM
jgi:hypothetical protein